jgi:toxin secretion/phage lysis holin
MGYLRKGNVLTHFKLETCREIIFSIGDHTFPKSVSALFFCTYAYIFGNGYVFVPVFILVVFDSITGVMKACKNKELSSSGWSRVAMKFFVYIMMLGTAGVLDREFPGQYATTTMKTFLMVTEAISIMENISALGWPVPLKLLEFLNMHSEKKREKKKD